MTIPFCYTPRRQKKMKHNADSHKWKKDAETITHEELTQEKDKCPFARISLKDVQKALLQ